MKYFLSKNRSNLHCGYQLPILTRLGKSQTFELSELIDFLGSLSSTRTITAQTPLGSKKEDTKKDLVQSNKVRIDTHYEMKVEIRKENQKSALS